MQRRCLQTYFLVLLGLFAWVTISRLEAQSSSSSTTKHTRQADTPGNPEIDRGSVSAGVYHNKTLGLTCTIPTGWVLRTDEMNSHDDETSPQETPTETENGRQGKVLLAAFSRPPEAKGSDVNSSILIAAEPVSAYPGLKDPAQYFEPLTEVAKAQGFSVDEEPYEISIGSKVLVRGDFHKDVGSRVMRQSTVAFLTRNYAVSVTVIGGTEDEVEGLLERLDFSRGSRAEAPK